MGIARVDKDSLATSQEEMEIKVGRARVVLSTIPWLAVVKPGARQLQTGAAPTKKVCDENKTNKQRNQKKRRTHKNIIDRRRAFIGYL